LEEEFFQFALAYNSSLRKDKRCSTYLPDSSEVSVLYGCVFLSGGRSTWEKGQNQGLVNALSRMKAVGRIAITGTLGFEECKRIDECGTMALSA
jgi:hypothetical protein